MKHFLKPICGLLLALSFLIAAPSSGRSSPPRIVEHPDDVFQVAGGWHNGIYAETIIIDLNHHRYCPRQCALIHVERIFDENVFTLRGRYAHERSDKPQTALENGVRMERALPLWSDQLGLQVRGDVVEFHPDRRIVPIEYKNGPRRERCHDDVQLCAQALCLEEMLGRAVETGAVYSLQTHRRREVVFTNDLREETKYIIAQVRAMQQSRGPLPPALNDSRCPRCSLLDACVPATVVAARHARLSQQLYTLPPEE